MGHGDRRREVSDAAYRRTPTRYDGKPSGFARWSLAILLGNCPGGQLVDLGCGPGRDSKLFADSGFRVVGVDHSSVAVERAREQNKKSIDAPNGSLDFVIDDILRWLCRSPSGSVSAVFGHVSYQTLSREELTRLFLEIHRILQRGGLHLYAVRDTTDPHCGQGEEMAPNVWAGGPHEVPYRYFTRDLCDELRDHGFDRVRLETDSGTHCLWVADQRRS